ncbi:MAG: metallophosphoesterase [Odoribacter splanchnicus]
MAIWLGTDFHLFKYDSHEQTEYRNRYFNVIMRNLRNTLTPDDLFLFLGDLTDGSIKDKNINGLFAGIPGYKVMLKGNNDNMEESAYRSAGFDKIVYHAVVVGNVLFTHNPVKVKSPIYNIHGHNHGRFVWGKSNRNFDAWSGKGKLISFHEAMNGHQLDLKYNIIESGQKLLYVDWKGCVKEPFDDLSELFQRFSATHKL